MAGPCFNLDIYSFGPAADRQLLITGQPDGPVELRREHRRAAGRAGELHRAVAGAVLPLRQVSPGRPGHRIRDSPL